MTGRMMITSGDAEGRVVEVGDELVLGRKGDGPGKLPGDVEISRSHARVYMDRDGGLAIEDLGSTNGTFVKGMRITAPHPLSPGDEVRVGQTTLEVLAREAAPVDEGDPPPVGPPIAVEEPAWETEGDELEPHEDEAPPEVEPEPPPEGAPVAHEEAPPEAAASPEAAAVPEQAASPEEAASPEAAAAPQEAAAPAPATGTGVPRPLVYVLIGVFALAALGIAAVVYFTGDEEEDRPAGTSAQGPPALTSAANEAGCVARDLPPEGNRKVDASTKVVYRSDPPHSGDHAEKPASDGIWETAPPLPKVVAALQQGRIVMWHKPGDEKGIRLLRDVGDQSPDHMLLVPNATMDYRVAATAWGHVLGCPRINGSTPRAVEAFRNAYRDKGPSFEP